MLRFSRNITLLILLAVSAFASAESKCQRAKESGEEVYQEVSG